MSSFDAQSVEREGGGGGHKLHEDEGGVSDVQVAAGGQGVLQVHARPLSRRAVSREEPSSTFSAPWPRRRVQNPEDPRQPRTKAKVSEENTRYVVTTLKWT